MKGKVFGDEEKYKTWNLDNGKPGHWPVDRILIELTVLVMLIKR